MIVHSRQVEFKAAVQLALTGKGADGGVLRAVVVNFAVSTLAGIAAALFASLLR